MSIAGELKIKMSYTNNQNCRQISSQIESTRPLQASKLFTGKSITQALTTIPLLFNICSKAQTVTALRAIESATQSPPSKQTESTREALITLENLREQTLRVVMDWPSAINEQADNQLLSHVSLGIKQLMQALENSNILTYKSKASGSINDKEQNKIQWESFSKTLSQSIFGSPARNWLDAISHRDALENWADKQQTQTARFIHWLNQKEWKHAGKSTIEHIPSINDNDLLNELIKQDQTFTSQPSWNNQCYELSWYSRKQFAESKKNNPNNPNNPNNNGIYNRMTARLKETADLITRLDSFFIDKIDIDTTTSAVTGMAHSEAARGRLTHYVEVEDDKINKLVILAPTEWNFHPNGVAVNSLNNLDASSTTELRQQAELLIHAIDPCVGYQLQITG
jgi:coenzyme F420-reducing hydrogenase alpha subunit